MSYNEVYRSSQLPKKLFICFNESALRMIRNAFYITLALFVLKILIFMSWCFGHVDQRARVER